MEDSEKPENCESRKRSREEDDGEEKAEEAEEISAKRPNNQPSTVYFKVLVPSSAAGAIIGKGGDTINQLQADTATNIKMSKGGDFFPGTTDRVCMIIGSLENIRKVHCFILDKVKEKPDASGTVGEVKAKIVVPNSTASLIIGKSGDNIKLIKDATNAFIQVSPKSTNTEKPLSERIITVSGDRESCEKAVDLILEKIVEDPQSGTCPNISYTDGPILPQSTIASLFATNLTNTLHLPVTGHPAMEALKFILRAKGYNEPATREITAAMYTLASYGFIQLRTPAIPTMSQEWPTTLGQGVASAEYYSQGSEATNATSAAANTTNQTQDQSNYANYYNSFYNASGNYGNGYNAGGSYDNSYGNTNYNCYGNSGMQSDMSGYSSGMGQGNYSMASGAAYSASASGGSYSMNYSMASGGGYQGAMGDHGAGGSSGPPPPPNNDASMTRQEVDVAENVLQAMMGTEGKGLMEIQQWCGVTMEVVQKAPFMHTVKVMGPQNSVQSALYLVQQYVQHAEYKRYYEEQTAQQQQQQQQQGTHQ